MEPKHLDQFFMRVTLPWLALAVLGLALAVGGLVLLAHVQTSCQ